MTAAGSALPASGPFEIELKYRLRDVQSGERWLAAETIGPFRAVDGPASPVEVVDRYLEVGERALQRAGFGARVRVAAGEARLTLKSTNAREAAGRPVRRQELDGPADPDRPVADWPPSAARDRLLDLAKGRPVEDLVTLRQRRRRRNLEAPDGTRVELSLDEVVVEAAGRVIGQFAELELELLAGDESSLADLGPILATDPGLDGNGPSKLATAIALIQADSALPRGRRGPDRASPAPGTPEPTRPRLTVGRTPGVGPDDTIAEAGRKVLRFHFARMLAREPGTRDGSDPEDLHGMRVATRRMRAAWRVFGDGFAPRRTRRLRRPLREIAGRLGAVRDLDVLLDGLEEYRARLAAAEARSMEPLAAAWREDRDAARSVLLRALDSDRYVRFTEDLLVFVVTEGAAVARIGPTTPHRIREVAPARIWAAYAGLRAYEAVLGGADVETLHELRIAAKWLRYTIEFVREPLGATAEPLIARVVAIQDHLGQLNDAGVAAELARQVLVFRADRITPAESAAIGRYVVDREQAMTRLRQTVDRTWRGVAGPAFRRGLGQVVAGL